MKKAQVEHILRAAKEICQDDEFFIIGSQSLHGKYPDLPDRLVVSMEIDLIAKNRPSATELLNNIGIDSPFHETFGVYADPVDFQTATLPRNWKNRLVHLQASEAANGVRAYCLEPHDLAVAKLDAWRDKDKTFLRALVELDLLDVGKLDRLIGETGLDSERQDLLRSRLAMLLKPIPKSSLDL